eukprot:3607336-Alexandrium_andersonii.AAC.1
MCIRDRSIIRAQYVVRSPHSGTQNSRKLQPDKASSGWIGVILRAESAGDGETWRATARATVALWAAADQSRAE